MSHVPVKFRSSPSKMQVMYNSSLRPPQPQKRGLTGVVGGPTVGTNNGGRPLLSPRGQKIREKATVDNEVGGPIYEDIDRMCSYRGYPPG